MRTILCCCARARVLSQEAIQKARESAAPMEEVADLCELVANGRFAAEGVLKVFACHPRAVKSLLAAAGLSADTVEVVNLRKQPAEPTPVPGAWFPVIDFARCTHCMQCLSFCLFGVFSIRDGKVRVAHPHNCKPNCPACARVCPEAAIIFPKHPEAVIHGADGQPGKVDLSTLLGGDAYQKLRDRSHAADDRTTAIPRAKPRERLAKLQKQLGIPDEVLQHLNVEPPPETK